MKVKGDVPLLSSSHEQQMGPAGQSALAYINYSYSSIPDTFDRATCFIYVNNICNSNEFGIPTLEPACFSNTNTCGNSMPSKTLIILAPAKKEHKCYIRYLKHTHFSMHKSLHHGNILHFHSTILLLSNRSSPSLSSSPAGPKALIALLMQRLEA